MKLAAVCTRDERKLGGDWRGIKGNFGPPGEQVDLSGVAKYADFDELLADRVDRPRRYMSAAEPARRSVDCGAESRQARLRRKADGTDGRRVRQDHESGRQSRASKCSSATCLPFLPEYAYARKAIDSGKYGKLLGGHFKRVISDPLWLKDFWDPKKVGGPLVDLHVHDAHFIRLLFGMPTAVTSQGTACAGDVVEYCVSQFQFADPSLVVSSASGVINQQGRPFTHGFEIHLEKATLYFDLAVLAGGKLQITPLTIVNGKGKAEHPKMPPGDPMLLAFDAEIKEVVQSVSRRQAIRVALRRPRPRCNRAVPQADAGGEKREDGQGLELLPLRPRLSTGSLASGSLTGLPVSADL